MIRKISDNGRGLLRAALHRRKGTGIVRDGHCRAVPDPACAEETEDKGEQKGKGAMIRAIPEPLPVPVDGELEATIRQLIARKDGAREGSAVHRMVIRQLDGLRGKSLLAEQIMEAYGYWG
jgi:hypothetical protein